MGIVGEKWEVGLAGEKWAIRLCMQEVGSSSRREVGAGERWEVGPYIGGKWTVKQEGSGK